jgi:hydrogenase/urease accessory protein HupE
MVDVGIFSVLVYSVRHSPGLDQGLKQALIIVSPLAAVAAVGCWGMWKQRAWGWWTALGLNALAILTIVLDLIKADVRPDLGDLPGLAVFAVGLALLLSAQMRNFFLRRSTAGPTSEEECRVPSLRSG